MPDTELPPVASRNGKEIVARKTLPELELAFRTHWEEAQRIARISVEFAWKSGRALTEIKARKAHGSWMDFLETEGISSSTALRLMKLARIQIRQIGEFETIAQALKSLPPKLRKAPPEPGGPSREEIRDIEAEAISEGERVQREEEACRPAETETEPKPEPEPEPDPTTWELLEQERKETRKLKRRLAAIKRALLADKSHAHILATQFGIQKA